MTSKRNLGIGAAAVAAEKKGKSTETLKEEKVKKTVRVFIIPTAIMKPLRDRESLKVWMKRAPTLWEAD